MAATYSITAKSPIGGGRLLVHGVYDTNDTDTVDIVTGCSAVEALGLSCSTVRNGSTEDHESTAGTITIASVTTADTGTFIAICRP